MSDSALIMIPMTYEHRCETNCFAWRNGPSVFAGFSVSSLARNETTQPPSTGGGVANAQGDLKLCRQKLRKAALKPLKQLVHVNLCARPRKHRLPPRKAEPGISSAFRSHRIGLSGLSGREVRYLLTTSSI